MQMRLPSWLYRIGLFLVFGSFFSPVFSQTIKGKVYDSKTGEPLIGATVTVENRPHRAVVNLDGIFVLRLPAAGKYRIFVSTIGYPNSKGIEVDVKGGNVVSV